MLGPKWDWGVRTGLPGPHLSHTSAPWSSGEGYTSADRVAQVPLPSGQHSLSLSVGGCRE